jgi:glutathione peroxidase
MKKLFLLLIFLTILLQGSPVKKTIYDFNVTTIEGQNISMKTYHDKVLLIVNVASKCKFTEQYEGLENLYQNYHDKDFEVLGFPSNQFLEQEPASNAKIQFFCTSTYDIHFDMFEKIDVNGDNTSPLYQYLKKEQTGFLWSEAIKWNFTKFLVDKNGVVIKRYAPTTEPKDIEDDILKLLQKI